MKISEDQYSQLSRSFRRIFALPISRLTIRELQNAINQALPENAETSKTLYESLITGDLKDGIKKSGGHSDLASLVEDYTYQFKIAREVAEMGEFMNSFSCDFLQQGNQVYFMNRMRRIDGEEYYFLSAPETNIRLAHMFINRLRDLKKSVGNTPLDPRLIAELNTLKTDVESLIL